MKSKYKFSELIEEISEQNTELKYGLDDIVGVTIEKGLIPTIANLQQTALNKFYIVKPDTFVYNPRTHGVRLGMGFNKTNYTYITSWNNIAFKVKDDALRILNPEYLWLYFNRSEWDRETNYHAWGSSTIVFSWNTFLNLEIQIPEKSYQDNLVRQYNAIKRRIALKQQINDNLASTLNELYKKYFTADNINELPVGWRIVPFSDIATIVMGQSPEGEYCNNEQIGEPLLNGPTEFGTYSPKPVQWTTDGKKYCNEGDILFCVRGSTTGRMNWADQSYVIGRGLAAIRHKSNTSLNWYVKAILDNHLRDILSAATGSTFPNVGKELLNEFKVIIPDESTLSMFSEKGAQLSCLIASNSKEIDKIEMLKELLLYRLSY